ncbi:MAG: hypothetical protein AAFN77_13235 [Planctomycetota bacterium]
MIHFTCDRCRRSIEDDELRFSVTIEVQVAIENDAFPFESTADQLIELEEILQQFDEEEREEITQFAYQRRQYDLCSDCQREYLKNPLAVEAISRVGFSEN